MLTELCKELNNYFCTDLDRVYGEFRIADGALQPPVELLDGQYFRLIGSIFNDGVHQNTESLQLIDEPEFDGAIWKMRVPPDVLELAERISEWREKNEAIDSENMSPFQSESFFEYSYSKGSTGQSMSGAGGTAVSWKSQFASELNKYRRIWGIV